MDTAFQWFGDMVGSVAEAASAVFVSRQEADAARRQAEMQLQLSSMENQFALTRMQTVALIGFGMIAAFFIVRRLV